MLMIIFRAHIPDLGGSTVGLIKDFNYFSTNERGKCKLPGTSILTSPYFELLSANNDAF